jgi:TolC family type I secretion outer membrane protein
MQLKVNKVNYFIIDTMYRPRLLPLTFAFLLASSPAQGEALEDVLRHVNATHPALQAEQAGVEASREGINEAYGGYYPSATTEFSHGKQDIKFNTLPSNSQDITTKNLTVVQPVFNGGETVARVGAAKARLGAAAARFRQVQQEVLLNAVTAYVGIKEKAEMLALAESNAESLESLLQATRKQFKASEVTVTDVSQSEARLARATAERHDAEAAFLDARASYLREVGKEPLVDDFPPLPPETPRSVEDLEEALADNPAVAEAEANEKAADFTIDERFAAILPDVALEGQVNDVEGSTLPTVFTRKDRSLVMRVTVPLYQSGAEYARLREAKHAYQQARSRKEDVSRGTREGVLREWNNYQAAGKAVGEYNAALTAADKALNSVRIEQEAGTRTVVDVLNEQDSRHVAQVGLLRAEARHRLGAYRLLAALGMLDRALAAGGPAAP